VRLTSTPHKLCLGSTVENMREDEDLGADGLPNFLTDYMTARRLVNEVYDRAEGDMAMS